MLEQYVNRKSKHHKTTSKVQRAKLVLLYVGVVPWVSVAKDAADSGLREPCGDGPGKHTGAAGKQGHTAMRYRCCLVRVGNSRNTRWQVEARREITHLDPNWRLP